jgi:hypothetical protein
MDLMELSNTPVKPVLYRFILDKNGLSYLNSADCFQIPPGDRTNPLGIPRVCPDGLVNGVELRMIPLSLFDRNRTSNNEENVNRNVRYFNYTPPASPYSDPRLSINKDKDYDGHISIEYGGDDCDDTNPNKFPGNPEIADFEGHDEDCNPYTIGVRDRDGDGFTDWRVYNKDDNGRILKEGDDCDDNDPSVHPRSPEVCDGKDNDCDGDVDEGVSRLYYRDSDSDGFGDPNERLGSKACHRPSGYVDNNRDCDDSDRTKTTDCK